MHYIFLQNALTLAYDATLVGSTAFFGLELALNLKQKWDALEVPQPVQPPQPAQLPAASIPLLESTAIPVESVAIAEKVAIPLDPIE
jgi:hypothetical protein